jgi:hypothetical protein
VNSTAVHPILNLESTYITPNTAVSLSTVLGSRNYT